jgi:hypothetical protein
MDVEALVLKWMDEHADSQLDYYDAVNLVEYAISVTEAKWRSYVARWLFTAGYSYDDAQKVAEGLQQMFKVQPEPKGEHHDQ